ncbi:STAS domain-containing protein [Cryptosporangium japonicum]|uniref:STAS domain-containing protein n=1 Tax=Cryptosporangium japonicum TaxID=80872 RepID=A0ABN0ULA8_9ACTN
MHEPLSLAVASCDPHPLVVLTGELEAGAVRPLPELVGRLLRDAVPRRIELDLGGVTFLDSAGLRALVSAHLAAAAAAVPVTLTNPSPFGARMLAATGDGRWFDDQRVGKDDTHGPDVGPDS